MADPASRSALEGLLEPRRSGREAAHPRVHLHERTGLAILEIAAWRDDPAALRGSLAGAVRFELPEQPGRAVGDLDLVALPTAPRRFWLVATPRGAARLEAVRDALIGRAALTDLGHAQTVLRLSGEAARKVLAKLCRIDLHPKVFAPGCVARTPLGPIAALIHCVEADAFDLYVPRSLARSGTEMLIDAAGEFGLEVMASIA